MQQHLRLFAARDSFDCAGDSTGEQLFNSLVVTLDPSHHHKLVTSYDQCVPKYHMRRMALLKVISFLRVCSDMACCVRKGPDVASTEE